MSLFMPFSICATYLTLSFHSHVFSNLAFASAVMSLYLSLNTLDSTVNFDSGLHHLIQQTEKPVTVHSMSTPYDDP